MKKIFAVFTLAATFLFCSCDKEDSDYFVEKKLTFYNQSLYEGDDGYMHVERLNYNYRYSDLVSLEVIDHPGEYRIISYHNVPYDLEYYNRTSFITIYVTNLTVERWREINTELNPFDPFLTVTVKYQLKKDYNIYI